LAPIAQGQLRRDAAAGFNAMNTESRKLGLQLVPTGSMSSYRSYAQQQVLWARYQAGTGNLAAKPGASNHGWGLAVDFATPQMRSMVDRIGAKYGWSKQWSDAPSEWWHVLFQPGHYHGPDPGPYGVAPEPPHETVALVVARMPNGGQEIFAEIASGEVLHSWQAEDVGWVSWVSLGTPGN
jgi:hypothetical protein